ncbi:MAG: hypothetical protein LBG77_00725, partial [Dysgonamonadaceae bacterium]|nr:hypothetical protein [Dysgonamonadaceae bacterium]
MKQYLMCLAAAILSFACTKQEIILVVHNPSGFDRNNEVTEVKINQKTIERLPELALFDSENNPV